MTEGLEHQCWARRGPWVLADLKRPQDLRKHRSQDGNSSSDLHSGLKGSQVTQSHTSSGVFLPGCPAFVFSAAVHVVLSPSQGSHPACSQRLGSLFPGGSQSQRPPELKGAQR